MWKSKRARRRAEPTLKILRGAEGELEFHPLRASESEDDEAEALPPSPVIHGRTDQGLHRSNNEDQFLVATLERTMRIHASSFPDTVGSRFDREPQAQLVVLADGMGGHGGGELASSVAVDAVAHYAFMLLPWFNASSSGDSSILDEGFEAALDEGQRRMREAADRKGVDSRLGTTLTMAYIRWPLLYIVHVGDSRAYLFRDGSLQQLTRDHTLAQLLFEGAKMEKELPGDSRLAHVLTKAVGGGENNIDAEVHQLELSLRDRLLLCSDGLSSEVDDDAIAAILASTESTEDVPGSVDALIDAAKSAGGHDNITAVLAAF